MSVKLNNKFYTLIIYTCIVFYVVNDARHSVFNENLTHFRFHGRRHCGASAEVRFTTRILSEN
jgi:hypothetical protein